MALAITITEDDCAYIYNKREVAQMYKEERGITEKLKNVRVAYQQGTGKRFVEVRFETEAHALYQSDLAKLIGCDCAVVGQCGTEWYVCGFNK